MTDRLVPVEQMQAEADALDYLRLSPIARDPLVPAFWPMEQLLRPQSGHVFQIDVERPVWGPYALAVALPDDVLVTRLRAGSVELITTPGILGAHLVSYDGKSRLPIEGPSLTPGQVISVTLHNPSAHSLVARATLYARTTPRFP